MQDILDAIEAARLAGVLGNDAARLASISLKLTGDEAMLALRALGQGADPASNMYLATGEVPVFIEHAHRNGPGGLVGAEQDEWLYQAAISADESKDSTLRGRILGLFAAQMAMANDTPADRRRRIDAKRAEIASLPFTTRAIGGREMRVYTADLGFAAAYWSGEPCAAVLGSFNGEPYLAVGSNGTPLVELGVKVGKAIAPCFGIVEDPATLATVRQATFR